MPKSHTRKLNDTQLVILSSASQREDGFAVLPEGVRAASVKAAVIRLSKLGFLKQVRVKRDQRTRRAGGSGSRSPPQARPRLASATTARARRSPRRSRSGGSRRPPSRERLSARRRASRRVEAAQIIALMQGVKGATLNDMVEVTGWLPHTTRAALTGLRHKGYAIARGKNARAETVYRIDAAAGEGTSSTGAEAHA